MSNTLPASLSELEDNDLDALMADLVAEINAVEESVAQAKSAGGAPKPPPPKTQDHAAPHPAVQNHLGPSIPHFAPSTLVPSLDLTTPSPALKPQLPVNRGPRSSSVLFIWCGTLKGRYK